jgi:hypothetical protein
MIGPAMRDRLLSVYEVWLQQDQFGQRYAQTSPPGLNAGVRSVRQFLEELMRVSSGPNAQVERPTALEHPDSTLLQLLGSRLVTQAGTGGPIEALARHALCLIPIPELLAQAAGNQSPFDDDNQNRPGPQPASHDLEDDDPGCLTLDPADHATLADMLMLALKSRVGHRTIRSFFTVEVSSNGYRLWAPQLRAPSDAGAALARHVVPTSAGDVTIDLRRYTDDDETTVRAYEWCAELRTVAASELPDAITYGMAYRFERTGGQPVGSRWDLIRAADQLADVDLLQVNAFLNQHDDAEALINEGDLAFVWLWERRAGTTPGAGQECLKAALADLKRRQRNIRTVVIDLKPYQYVVIDGSAMPTTLHIEKLEALDRLQSFIDGLRLGEVVKGHCRYIVNRDGDDTNAAMRALGLAGLALQDARWRDGT